MSRFVLMVFGCACVSLLLPASLVHAQAKEKRLDYKQAQALKDAVYFLDQSEGILQQIDKLSASWKPGDATVPIDKVNNLLANKDRVAQYLKNAQSRFEALPASHSEVAPELKRLESLKTNIAATEKKLTDIQKGLMGVVNQGAAPEFKVDFDRVREINQTFSRPEIIRSRPEAAVETIKQIAPMKEDRQRIAQKYAALMNQPTGEAKQMREVLAYFDEVFPKFEKAALDYAAGAPAEIAKDIDDAMKMADDASANKKPLFFGENGGIRQHLGMAETKLSVLQALSPDAEPTKQSQAKLEAARAKVKQMAAALSESIIESNVVPPDQYAGPDAAMLKAIVTEKWAKEGNGLQVLKHGINSKEWQRDTRWEWNRSDKAWYKVDKSRAQGHVVVKLNDTMAAVYYVNLVRDHLANDSVKAYFLDETKGEPDVQRKILLKNVK